MCSVGATLASVLLASITNVPKEDWDRILEPCIAANQQQNSPVVQYYYAPHLKDPLPWEEGGTPANLFSKPVNPLLEFGRVERDLLPTVFPPLVPTRPPGGFNFSIFPPFEIPPDAEIALPIKFDAETQADIRLIAK